MSKRALLIGIDGYPSDSGLAPLKFAEADAAAVEKKLSEEFDFQTTLLCGRDATRDAIEKFIYERKGGETFLFFFAGHGQLVKGQYHLHPVDSWANGRGAISLEFFNREWQDEKFGFENVVALIDACRKEAPGIRGKSGFTAESTRDISSVTLGRRRVEVLYGCSEGQVSYEDENLGHGVFTHALLQVFKEEHAQLDTDILAGSAADLMLDWSNADPDKRRQVAHRYHVPSLRKKIILGAGAQCSLCGHRNPKQRTFECPRCHTKNLCLGHRLVGSEVCPACSVELEKELEALARVRAEALKLAETERLAKEEAKRVEEERLAKEQANEYRWGEAQALGTVAGYRAYLSVFPEGPHAADAKSCVEELLELESWESTLKAGTVARFAAFLQRFPEGPHAAEAAHLQNEADKRAEADRQAWESVFSAGRINAFAESERRAKEQIEDNRWQEAQALGTLADYQAYLSAFPVGIHAAEAKIRAEEMLERESWGAALAAGSIAAFADYRRCFPKGPHFAEAACLEQEEFKRIKAEGLAEEVAEHTAAEQLAKEAAKSAEDPPSSSVTKQPGAGGTPTNVAPLLPVIDQDLARLEVLLWEKIIPLSVFQLGHMLFSADPKALEPQETILRAEYCRLLQEPSNAIRGSPLLANLSAEASIRYETPKSEANGETGYGSGYAFIQAVNSNPQTTYPYSYPSGFRGIGGDLLAFNQNLHESKTKLSSIALLATSKINPQATKKII